MIIRLFMALFVLVQAGCDRSEPGAIALARDPGLVADLILPEGSRPKGAPTKGPYAYRGDFELFRSDQSTAEYRFSSPFRAVFYTKYTRKQPPGMSLRYKGQQLAFHAQDIEIGPAGTWGYDKGEVVLRLAANADAPKLVALGFPAAKAAEDALNFETAELPESEFVFRSLPLTDSVDYGLFLPAPATVSFDVVVPREGLLSFSAHLVKPVVPAVLKSDGARLHIEVERRGEGTVQVAEFGLEPGSSQPCEVSLAGYQGEKVRLQLRTTPGKTPRFDYVFVGEPVLATPTKKPRKLLLVFIDTLRPDHLGTYGYSRPTTPALDSWSQEALVFENARAPAPWTLPSALSALTGHLPEKASSKMHIGELLASNGWVTASMVSNSWLSGSFGLGEGWTHHSAGIGVPAKQQVNSTLKAFEKYKDRDLAVMVHFIDPHLPYSEPKQHQGVFAGEAPPLLPGRVDHELVNAAMEKVALDDQQALKDYVIARYDQNIHYVDAELKRLFEAVGPETTVVVFSDHGEEFWEHGGFEHGHTLYDELLKVPLMMRGPGIKAGRVEHPVSLMDIVPTILDNLDLEVPPLDGASLVGIFAGTPVEQDSRALSFGSNLFGSMAWGVLVDGKKWMVAGGRQQLFDLEVDPGETKDLGAPSEALAEDLRGRYLAETGRQVKPFVRVAASGKNRSWGAAPALVTLRSDVPWMEAFGAVHPVGDFLVPKVLADSVVLRNSRSQSMPREFFVQPDQERGRELALSIDLSGPRENRLDEVELGPLGVDFEPIGFGTYGGRSLEVGWSWMPAPAALELASPAIGTTEALRELGYLQ